MPDGKLRLASTMQLPPAVMLPPSQGPGSTMIAFTLLRAACMPAATPAAPPPITSTSVFMFCAAVSNGNVIKTVKNIFFIILYKGDMLKMLN